MLRATTYVTLNDNSRVFVHIYLPLAPVFSSTTTNGWLRQCINMFEFFTTSSPYKDRGIEFATRWLSFVRNSDFWIDEISIQQGSNQSKFHCVLLVY